MNTVPVRNGSVRNSSVDQRSFLETDPPLPLEPAELRVLIPVILGVLCVLGLAGNVTATGVLISSARKAKLSLINALLLNLLLADGLVLALVVPSKAAVLSSRVGWPLGWFACKTGDWLVQTCLAAKSVTLAVMSGACHRYVSNPSRVVSVRPGCLALLLPLLWATAGCLALPAGLYATLAGEGGVRACVWRVPMPARRVMWAYTHAYPLLAYCCPLGIAVTMFCRAYCQSRRRGSKAHSNLRAQIRSRKLTLTLLGLTVTMATLWLPRWLWWVWPNGGGRGLYLAAELLPLAMSLVDPALVLALSEEFRHGYRSLWRRLTLRQAPPPAKPKPNPHTPTAPTSPRPRPETSLPPAETQPAESPSADGVLPDVEQFWHERENTSHTDNNDPIPWEHN
ncbi:G-protein coupled receptor 151 [Sardina pilchardus]|uniref:G-protein coupled receptor 151 n=1 Tax=Sardina pilchardus TaxID=27697 RepID=UPI002E1345CA